MASPRASDRDALPGAGVPARPLAGVVLCGGRSTRMGFDKATLRFQGETLLHRALARLDTVCDPVMVAPGDLALTLTGRASAADAVHDSGPLGGLVTALRLSRHRLLAVVAVDLPWIDPQLLRLLADAIGEHDVAVCETAHGIEPLHAVYSTSLLEAAETALISDDRSMRHLIAGSNALYMSESDWRAAGISEDFTYNVNTPQDLDEVSRRPRR
jgi:molybdopterin-guanine dinucleotide biosynthesis protein A